jgi:EipB-like
MVKMVCLEKRLCLVTRHSFFIEFYHIMPCFSARQPWGQIFSNTPDKARGRMRLALIWAGILSSALTLKTALAQMDGAAFQPHQALYELYLQRSDPAGTVAYVEGKMTMEWGDVCKNWSLDQRYRLDFQYRDGNSTQIESHYVTKEAKDGSEFHYRLTRKVDGTTDTKLEGKVTRQADGMLLEQRQPEPLTRLLPQDVLFPLSHTLLTIKYAVEGKRIFYKTLFDGADEVGLSAVSTLIGSAQPLPAPSNHPLINQVGWPVKMAFFPPLLPERGELPAVERPDYEMTLTLLANGIVRDIIFDYGDFTMQAKLRRLEAVSARACPP